MREVKLRPLRRAQMIHMGEVKLDRRDKLRSVCETGEGRGGEGATRRPRPRNPGKQSSHPTGKGKRGGERRQRKKGGWEAPRTKGPRDQGGNALG